MSAFFDWIGDFTPSALVLVLWGLLLPIRLGFLLCIPYGAKNRYHYFNPMYEFFAFEGRL